LCHRRKLWGEDNSLGEHATTLQRAQYQEKKNAHYRKLRTWQETQALYIPAINTLRIQNDESFYATDSDTATASLDSESEILLPSSIGNRIPWDKQLGEFEWLFRIAQAHDSLHKLRDNLRLKEYLSKTKKQSSRGVRENTRSQTQINNVVKKIQTAAIKYRVARSALSALTPILGKDNKWSSELQVLKDNDIRSLPVEGLGEGSRTLSWIWTSAPVSSDEAAEPQMVDGLIYHLSLIKFTNNSSPSLALRVQWCRAHARVMRWTEEIDLVQEEMRRVCAYLSWYANWWTSHVNVGYVRQYDSFLSEGLAAYAERQAHLRTSLQGRFQDLWCNVAAWVAAKKVPDAEQVPDADADDYDD
jgi:hypothetical protein